jgi:hypothetical protein
VRDFDDANAILLRGFAKKREGREGVLLMAR